MAAAERKFTSERVGWISTWVRLALHSHELLSANKVVTSKGCMLFRTKVVSLEALDRILDKNVQLVYDSPDVDDRMESPGIGLILVLRYVRLLSTYPLMYSRQEQRSLNQNRLGTSSKEQARTHIPEKCVDI